jgi:2-oxoglutarate ferredoxin oxidoreductase subunit gamma
LKTEKNILIAGFGGQGVVMAGNVLAYAAVEAGKNLLATVSYGAEMRGGTARANLTISDNEIDSPIIDVPNLAMIMNAPSFVKYIDVIEKGSSVILNSSMIDDELIESKDGSLDLVRVDATNYAIKMGNIKVANIIMLGVLVRHTGILDKDSIKHGMERAFRKNKKALIYINDEAFELGYSLEPVVKV